MMVPFILAAAAAAALQVQVNASAGRDSANRREVSVGLRIGSAVRDTGKRIPVTAAHLASAFHDGRARTMLTGARMARFRQDSALRTYDAKVFQRISVGMALRANARNRLLVRDEGVARVQWDQSVNGAVVDMLGKRTTIPMSDEPEQVGEGVRNYTSLPIPYFPGRETLWLGASVARVDVDERSFVHPLATGSEAYYTYATGDSIEFTLPNGARFMLRELRIEAREPQWNLIVGSFWFDQATAQLVRAVYRPAVKMDIWKLADETAREEGEDGIPLVAKAFLPTFTASMEVFMVEYSLFEQRFWLPVKHAAEGRAQLAMMRVPVTFEERYDYLTVNGPVDVAAPIGAVAPPPPTFNSRIIRDSLARAGLTRKQVDSVVTARLRIRNDSIAGRMRANRDSVRRDSLVKAGLTREQADSFVIERNRNDSLSTRVRVVRDSLLRDSLMSAGFTRVRADSVIRARAPRTIAFIRDSVLRDSLRKEGFNDRRADSVLRARARTRTDSARAAFERECAAAGHTARRLRRYEDRVDVLLRAPCDLKTLLNSPELPPSAYETKEDLFDTAERDKLIGALDFALQAGWGPQAPAFSWGISQTRYNRVEGFSTGIGVRQELGLGYTWSASLRGSQGDRQVNGELGIERSNGRTTLRANAYRRLVSASDWGTPLSFSAGLSAFLNGRDEGFYYRALGGELTRASQRDGNVTWRLFAEQQTNAPVTTRFSLFGGSHDDDFGPNVVAKRATFVGGGVRWSDSWGLAPRGWRTLADVRLEGAGGTQEYGRGALDLTVSHGLPFATLFGVTAAGGTSVGELAPQRHWFLGGVHTVRGQDPGASVGDAFWFSRVELARGSPAFRPSLFGDLGWAGSRDGDWGRSERLMSGVGIGASMFDGMLRWDLARGLWPKKQWRFDFSVEARF